MRAPRSGRRTYRPSRGTCAESSAADRRTRPRTHSGDRHRPERWRRSLDVLVEHFARRSLATIDGDVLHILRLSLYQLLHLDRVPASAVVNDAVVTLRAHMARRVQTRFFARRCATAAGCRCLSGPNRRRIAGHAVSRHYPFASGVAGCAMARPVWICTPSVGCASTTRRRG